MLTYIGEEDDDESQGIEAWALYLTETGRIYQ